MPELIATCLVELGEITDGEQSVLLMPAGDIAARDGRRWRNPDPAGVIDRSLVRAGDTELVVDYEHQTDLVGQNGQPAPAAGWITKLTAAADGIRALIRWNEKALAHIRAKEYRYLSPTFTYDKAGRVQVILRAALTNSPALDLPALASDRGGSNMHKKLLKLLEKFGLTVDKVEDEAALDAALAKAEDIASNQADIERADTAKALGLAADADQVTVVAKAKELAAGKDPDPGAYVPMDEFKAVASQLKTLQDERTEEKANAQVDEGIRTGKITPAMRDWALGYAGKDPDGFTAYLAALPVLIKPGSNPPAGDENNQADAALTDDELAVCKAMGLTEDQFKAGRKDILDRQAGEHA